MLCLNLKIINSFIYMDYQKNNDSWNIFLSIRNRFLPINSKESNSMSTEHSDEKGSQLTSESSLNESNQEISLNNEPETFLSSESYNSECSIETQNTCEMPPEPVYEDWLPDLDQSNQFVLYNNNLQETMQESEPYEESKLIDLPDNNNNLSGVLSNDNLDQNNSYDVNDYSYIYNNNTNTFDDKNVKESEMELLGFNWLERILYYSKYPRYFFKVLYDTITHFKWML